MNARQAAAHGGALAHDRRGGVHGGRDGREGARDRVEAARERRSRVRAARLRAGRARGSRVFERGLVDVDSASNPASCRRAAMELSAPSRCSPPTSWSAVMRLPPLGGVSMRLRASEVPPVPSRGADGEENVQASIDPRSSFANDSVAAAHPASPANPKSLSTKYGPKAAPSCVITNDQLQSSEIKYRSPTHFSLNSP